MAVSSSTTISSTVSAVPGVLSTTVTNGSIHSETVPTTAVGDSIFPTSAEAAPIFLETKAAQGIAGVFVWVALFITCQQVCCF
ncbi:hypothetical protein Cfor_03671 [Coptotermes formosanus]|uniref:Uncharacterized protein n=1 Tax=Coptotermes formosanus TaxID=36987 RepID=A0A6L2PZV2_COPFO|nr:hypothetical protein Cfor_03671 [Coptotermes formosanus]